MIFELQSTKRMGDTLHGIGNWVGKIIHWIDAPLVPGFLMALVLNAIQGGIAHVDIGAGHVNLGPKDMLTVLVVTRTHLFEHFHILFYGTIAVW